MLSGGSAFGLDAAGGVMAWLAARGRGFPVGDAVVPIVPAAILFDLGNGGDKGWGDTPPYRGPGSCGRRTPPGRRPSPWAMPALGWAPARAR